MVITAKDVLKEIDEISDRRRQQLQDDLNKFKNELKSAKGSDKKSFEDAIEATELSLGGKPVSDKMRQAIFKALELIEKE
jgi:hypothetical protein